MDTYDAEDVFELLNYRGKKLMFYDVEIWNQRALEVRNLRLSLRRGVWRFWSWLRCLGWLKVASRSLRSFTWQSSEIQSHKEIRGHLLATSRPWRRRKFLCLAKVPCLIPSRQIQGHVNRHLCLRIMGVMIQMTRIYIYNYIQDVPVGKVNILGGQSIGHFKQKCLYEHASYSERFPR